MQKELSRKSYVNVDFFKEVMDLEHFFTVINETADSLEDPNITTQEKKKVIEEFCKKAKNWEIVVCDPGGTKVWVQIPLILHDVQYENSLTHRIKKFVKDGKLIKKNFRKRDLDIVTNVDRFLNINAVEANFSVSDDEEVNNFYCVLTLLMIRAAEIVEQFGTVVAVYEKPNGIIAANVMRSFLDELQSKSKMPVGNLKASVETSTFYDLIADSKVTYHMGDEYIEE